MLRVKTKAMCSRRSGAAAAELAMALPFLCLVFAVSLDYCRIYYVTQTVQNCAWAGAMYASGTASNPNAASVDDAVSQAALAEATNLSPALDPTKVTTQTQGNNVVVTVQYQFQALTPLVGSHGVITISRTATMAIAPSGR